MRKIMLMVTLTIAAMAFSAGTASAGIPENWIGVEAYDSSTDELCGTPNYWDYTVMLGGCRLDVESDGAITFAKRAHGTGQVTDVYACNLDFSYNVDGMSAGWIYNQV